MIDNLLVNTNANVNRRGVDERDISLTVQKIGGIACKVFCTSIIWLHKDDWGARGMILYICTI
jgi:hypothetical protein